MLISKKLIHLFNITIIQIITHRTISKLLDLITTSLLYFKNMFVLYNFLFEKINKIKLNNYYLNICKIKLQTSTKYLFIFTSYIIYSKLNIINNLFFFKFHLSSKKQKKFTILRAPCNHKNSKEQFGFTIYRASIKLNLVYQNNFYNDFFFSVLSKEKTLSLTELYKKYEKKYVS